MIKRVYFGAGHIDIDEKVTEAWKFSGTFNHRSFFPMHDFVYLKFKAHVARVSGQRKDQIQFTQFRQI